MGKVDRAHTELDGKCMLHMLLSRREHYGTTELPVRSSETRGLKYAQHDRGKWAYHRILANATGAGCTLDRLFSSSSCDDCAKCQDDDDDDRDDDEVSFLPS